MINMSALFDPTYFLQGRMFLCLEAQSLHQNGRYDHLSFFSPIFGQSVIDYSQLTIDLKIDVHYD